MKLIVTARNLIAFSLLQRASCFMPQGRSTPFATRLKEQSFADNALAISAAAGALRGQTVVVKYGGNAMTSPELALGFCQDVAALQKLGIRVVVVHGGGPQINSMLEKVGIESRFEGGFRVSTTEVVEVAEMVLCGSVNKGIAARVGVPLASPVETIPFCVAQSKSAMRDLIWGLLE
jgi:hypothetical protein